MKIAIIIPYFGEFPAWFNLYLFSCSQNPQVDFLFFTDCKLPIKTYENTKFFRIDYVSYCKHISDCLNIDFQPKNPYKLCDLKPFLGIVHQAELQGYDYWGFGDCDLIYGDLSIITKNLSKYEFITTHGGRVAGHFTIMKKDSVYTNLCRHINNWEERLKEEKTCMLDEVDFTYIVYPQLKAIARIYHYIVRPIGVSEHSFFNCFNSIFCNKKTKFWEYDTTPTPRLNEEWLYDIQTGAINKIGVNKPIPYLHFLLFKKNAYFNLKNHWGNIKYMTKFER